MADAATAGECFAWALAAKDSGALCALLGDPVDFQALTPGRHWQAGTGRQAVEEIILAWWFGAGDDIIELCSVTPGRVLDREHVAYRVRVRREGRAGLRVAGWPAAASTASAAPESIRPARASARSWAAASAAERAGRCGRGSVRDR
jgi:hypothetical protein